MQTPRPPADTIHGRVLYLLVLVALLHSVYPITLTAQGATYTPGLVVYQLLYFLMILAGIWVAGDSPLHRGITVVSGAIYLVFGLLYALDPTDAIKILATYLALIVFQGTVLSVLVRYIFRARRVTRDVLFAAVTVYLLLGALFVPLYGLLDFAVPGSYLDNMAAASPLPWQTLIYYSFVTLTTAGYGDILPITPWARVLANIEMVAGVLYIAVLMARLVGLYAQHTDSSLAGGE